MREKITKVGERVNADPKLRQNGRWMKNTVKGVVRTGIVLTASQLAANLADQALTRKPKEK